MIEFLGQLLLYLHEQNFLKDCLSNCTVSYSDRTLDVEVLDPDVLDRIRSLEPSPADEQEEEINDLKNAPIPLYFSMDGEKKLASFVSLLVLKSIVIIMHID